MTNVDGEFATDECKTLCKTLLNTEQTIPQDSLFNDDVFERICQSIQNRNEARVVRDLTPLLVPSAEILYLRGATQLRHLIETVNEIWIKSVSLVVNGPRPQPDFSVGLRQSAFTPDQLKKLKPLIGDWRNTSSLMATDEMYFPFLTVEVKCGNEALNVADRQNAHSASVAANAVIELYRAVSRQEELHRKILTFSISHDNEAVRFYGHFALIAGRKEPLFYRHPIKKFDFTNEDGKEKWTPSTFTQNLYHIYHPLHFKIVCDGIDQLPNPDIVFEDSFSQQSDLKFFEEDDSPPTPSCSQQSGPTLPSSHTSEPLLKKTKDN